MFTHVLALSNSGSYVTNSIIDFFQCYNCTDFTDRLETCQRTFYRMLARNKSRGGSIQLRVKNSAAAVLQ